ncbi:MAG: hypothetical protein B6D61_07530 [Bacteroidetes bacterium 4484_249]|nr:MAG: hypothetical protein B6D61_07530 [Bacteroidetes bacterium 4484_249]
MSTTLEINLQDDLVNLFGVRAIKNFIEEELAYQRFKLLENELIVSLSETKDVDWEKEFEKARQKAFDKYKKSRENI